MLLSELITAMQASLALHGDYEVVTMEEAEGEIDYWPVSGVSFTDIDGGDNDSPSTMYVINTEY